MANQAFSLSEDLMVGAGEVMFKRADDANGWHTLGNCDEMNITVDVTKVEKSSSMNRKRTLMQSVVTAVKPTTTITLTEYNPYNMALGLFGTESITHVDEETVDDFVYTVTSVPGIITLYDADGNRVLNAENIKVEPAASIPAKSSFVSVPSYLGAINTTKYRDDTLVDIAGGKITLDVSKFSGDTDNRLFFAIRSAPTSAGSLVGLVLEYREGILGTPQKITLTSSASITNKFHVDLLSGLAFDIEVSTNDSFTVTPVGSYIEVNVFASSTTYVQGRDYYYDDQTASAGIIKIDKGSAIQVGDNVKVSYTRREADYINVSLADAGAIEGELLYIGDNDTGPNYVIEGWKVKVTPSGDLSGLIGTDFGSFQLSIDFIDDSVRHPDFPFAKITAVKRSTNSEIAKYGTYHPEW